MANVEEFLFLVQEFAEWLWFIPLILIVLLGIVATIKFKGIQFTSLREMVRITFSRDQGRSGITPFQVFCVSMGNRIGVGNIVGPITAIMIGGPGAIFWIWIFATLGGATSFLETTIGQIFKSSDGEGGFIGGPAHNVAKGLSSRKLGMVVAGLMILVYVSGYILAEISAISISFTSVYDFDNNYLVIAIVLAVIAILVALGGFKRIAQASTFIVPAMAVAWVIICLSVILINYHGIPGAIASIFSCAFNVPAAVGGGVGGMLTIALRRGIWSNEAGEGTITNISSSADVSHPVKQGLSQALGVLIDTLVCTMVALVVLGFAGYDEIVDMGLDSMSLLEYIISSTLGGDFTDDMVFVFLFLFAITSFMGDYVISENNLKFITRGRPARLLLIVFTVIVVFLSAYYGSDGLFAIMDVLLAICCIVNCVVIFKLINHAMEAYRDYREQKAEGIADPVFHRDTLSDPSEVTEWKD